MRASYYQGRIPMDGRDMFSLMPRSRLAESCISPLINRLESLNCKYVAHEFYFWSQYFAADPYKGVGARNLQLRNSMSANQSKDRWALFTLNFIILISFRFHFVSAVADRPQTATSTSCLWRKTESYSRLYIQTFMTFREPCAVWPRRPPIVITENVIAMKQNPIFPVKVRTFISDACPTMTRSLMHFSLSGSCCPRSHFIILLKE